MNGSAYIGKWIKELPELALYRPSSITIIEHPSEKPVVITTSSQRELKNAGLQEQISYETLRKSA